jgi:hypothetical protein
MIASASGQLHRVGESHVRECLLRSIAAILPSLSADSVLGDLEDCRSSRDTAPPSAPLGELHTAVVLWKMICCFGGLLTSFSRSGQPTN